MKCLHEQLGNGVLEPLVHLVELQKHLHGERRQHFHKAQYLLLAIRLREEAFGALTFTPAQRQLYHLLADLEVRPVPSFLATTAMTGARLPLASELDSPCECDAAS